MTEAKAAVERLKGERDILREQHGEAASKFSAANADVTTGKLSMDLHEMDEGRHQQAIADMEVKADSYPLWRKFDFLERPEDAFDPNDPA